MMNLMPELSTREIARIDAFVLKEMLFVATDLLQYNIIDYEKKVKKRYSLFRGAEIQVLKHAQKLLFSILRKNESVRCGYKAGSN